MILESDSLWSTPTDHLSGTSFEADRATGLWAHYTRHDYATFNPFHTWVEFINRLLGAFAGLPALILVALTLLLGIRHGQWRPLAPAMGALFALAFVAWLGKKVVDGNLIPGSITLHMMGALAILGLQLATLRVAGAKAPKLHRVSKVWLALAVIVTLAQLVFGTQVREAVDQLVHDGVQRSEWIANLPAWWTGHRTAFWMVLAVHVAALWPGLRSGQPTRWEWTVVLLLSAQFATGLAFGWLGMPAAAQPIHLMLAVGLVLTDGWLLGAKPLR
jgi:cytochrome c oxidase assembly protein subunit 15